MGYVPFYSAPPSLPESSVKVEFSGDRGEFFRLVRNGAALELITFGFYRFWLATDIRRHLWSHTSLDGDAPEYTGRGGELLIGFLFAMAILVPIYLAYFVVTIEAERYTRPLPASRSSCSSICSDSLRSIARGAIA